MNRKWYILTMLLCFSYQASKTFYKFQNPLRRLQGYVSIQQKNSLQRNLVFDSEMNFTIGAWIFNTDSNQKKDTKQRLRSKILTFATDSLFHVIFSCDDSNHVKVQLQHFWPRPSAAQVREAKQHFQNVPFPFILLLVPGQQATLDTKF